MKAMRRIRGNRVGNEDGIAMLFVIFAIMVIGILGAATLLYTSLMLRNSVGVTPSSRALAAAEAGLDIAHAMLAAEDPDLINLLKGNSYTIPTGTLWSGDGTYDVTVTKDPIMGDGDPYDWRIVSSGEYKAYVEGVERTFYRSLEEVISFAGGHYYNALDYILYSKEGSININLDGDLGFLNFETIEIGEAGTPSHIYAGNDVILADSAKIGGTGSLDIYGNVITEYGDIIVRNTSAIIAGSDVNINGNLYSGILNPGGVGGGVNLETNMGFIGGNSINVTGQINAHGRLNDYPYGVRVDNFVGVGGGSTTSISGSILSREDIFCENSMGLITAANIDIDGNIHCGGDVEIRNSMGLAGVMGTDVNGGIYADGDVTLHGEGFAGGSIANQVGGDIHSGEDVHIYQVFGGLTNGGRYAVGGSIYGRNVTLESSVGALGSNANVVSGSIYARGDFDLSTYAGAGSTCDATISGSVYSQGSFDVSSRANGLWPAIGKARARINGGGGIINPPNLAGGFSGSEMNLSAQENVHFIVNDEAVTRVQPNARRSSGAPSITETNGGDVQEGTTAPAVGGFSVPLATEPQEPSEYNEVLMPECDFDWYRQTAKQQQIDDGTQHYFQGDTTIDMGQAAFKSSVHVMFVDGNMTLGTIDIPLNTAGVFVATGDIHLSDVMRTADDAQVAECQVISNGKVYFGPGFNMSVNDDDLIFIYAGHEDYDPNDPNERVSVEYEMGWFRDVWMQITARGDIEIESHDWAFIGAEVHRIKFKNPSVLGDAFRIPFTVKYWKEI
jgi:hypothetical protein